MNFRVAVLPFISPSSIAFDAGWAAFVILGIIHLLFAYTILMCSAKDRCVMTQANLKFHGVDGYSIKP
jgi:hypothetical protein